MNTKIAIAKRTAHMTASLTGFAKVPTFHEIFPAVGAKPRSLSASEFFRRLGTNVIKH